jgi:hypothetical protein
MTRLFLASAFALLAGSAFAQTTTQRMPEGLVPTETAEWTILIASTNQNSVIAFGNTLMTETACLEAAQQAPTALKTALRGGWIAFGAACMNTRTGAVVAAVAAE